MSLSSTVLEAGMKRAIELSLASVAQGTGPFGAVLLDAHGEVIAAGHNRVAADCDPSAHAEVVTIRLGANLLKSHDLSAYTLVSSCEPCPMCYFTAHWAGIQTVYYAATAKDAEMAGFDDADLWSRLGGERAQAPELVHVPAMREPARDAFRFWQQRIDAGELTTYNPGMPKGCSHDAF